MRRIQIHPLHAVVIGIALTACASGAGKYVWSSAYKDDPPPAVYLVNAGDLLSIMVWDNDKMSTRQRVRDDGRISIPLLGDVPVVGEAPEQIARELEKQLKDSNLVLNPRVTVIVEEEQAFVYVIGAVKAAGKYPLPPGSGVAEALALAGGLTDFAHRNAIYVIRRTPTPTVIRFTFQSITAEGDPATLFRLQPGDVVKVE